MLTMQKEKQTIVYGAEQMVCAQEVGWGWADGITSALNDSLLSPGRPGSRSSSIALRHQWRMVFVFTIGFKQVCDGLIDIPANQLLCQQVWASLGGCAKSKQAMWQSGAGLVLNRVLSVN